MKISRFEHHTVITLDEPTKQIAVYGAEVERVNQDKMKRVHISVKIIKWDKTQ